MKIRTLLDLKNVLDKVPEKDLAQLGVGIDSDGEGYVKIVSDVENFENAWDNNSVALEVLQDYVDGILAVHDLTVEDMEMMREKASECE